MSHCSLAMRRSSSCWPLRPVDGKGGGGRSMQGEPPAPPHTSWGRPTPPPLSCLDPPGDMRLRLLAASGAQAAAAATGGASRRRRFPGSIRQRREAPRPRASGQRRCCALLMGPPPRRGRKGREDLLEAGAVSRSAGPAATGRGGKKEWGR